MYHPELIYHQHNILKPSEFRKNLHRLTYFDKKIPLHVDDKITTLKQQCLGIYERLKPLNRVGIFFSMALVGGSVRDLLAGLDDKITDLDIVVNFSSGYNPFPFSHNEKSSLKKVRKILGIKEDSGLAHQASKKPFGHWNQIFSNPLNPSLRREASKIGMCYDMVYSLLEDQIELSYAPNEKKTDTSYLDYRLNGVLKLKGSPYPIDILITHMDSCRRFTESFDFDICKCGVQLEDVAMARRNRDIFPQTNREFLDNIFVGRNFIKELKEKSINIYVETPASLVELQASVEIHLPKILAKYPYTLLMNKPDLEMYREDHAKLTEKKMQFVESWMLKRELSQNLIEKNDINLKNKI